MTQNGLPHSVEAERAVLGTMLRSPAMIPEARRLLTPADFYNPDHRSTYAAILAVHERQVVDSVTVREELSQRGQLESVGGASFLAEILDGEVGLTIKNHAEIIRSRTLLRRMIEAGEDLVEAARHSDDPQVTLSQHRESLAELASISNKQNDSLAGTPWASDLPEAEIPQSLLGEGLLVLGEPGKTCGTLAIVSGDRGLGKTWWVLETFRALSEKVPVALILNESERWETLQRRDLLGGEWSQVVIWDKLDLYADTLNPFLITDPSWQERIVENCTRRGVRALAIDSLGKAVAGSASLIDDQESTRLLASLERIARAIGGPVVMSAHQPKPGQMRATSERWAFGSQVWESIPRTVGQFHKTRGALQLNWKKVHGGRPVPPQWFALDSFPLEEIDTPENTSSQKSRKLELAREIMGDGQPRTLGELSSAMAERGGRVTPDTLRRRYVKGLGLQSDSGRPKRYYSTGPDTESRPNYVRVRG